MSLYMLSFYFAQDWVEINLTSLCKLGDLIKLEESSGNNWIIDEEICELKIASDLNPSYTDCKWN